MSRIQTGLLLSKIRGLFDTCSESGGIDAYIVFSNDRHMSEFCAESDQRRKFISGFGGSRGTVVITRDQALLWTDGRYYLEASLCLDENWTLMKEGTQGVPSVIDWLTSLPEGYRIGTDLSYMSHDDWETFSKKLTKSRKSIVSTSKNLVDIIWEEIGKPKEILNDIYVHELRFSGVTWQEKVETIREKMRRKNSEVLVLSALDEIAWLFNLRGSDIPHCPVFKSFAVVTLECLYLFVDINRLSYAVLDELNVRRSKPEDSVIIFPYDSVENILKFVCTGRTGIWISTNTPQSLVMQIPDSFFVETNPVTLQKSIKNATELEGIKRACTREAALLCNFFGFLERNILQTKLNEKQASDILSAMRSKMENYVMDSFETILSVGPTGAIIHYQPTHETALTLEQNQIILCDTGGNYLDGTTDITRTLHFGDPTEFEKECYTFVLKAHIALAQAKFIEGATGAQLDGISRSYLWRVGLNFQHGLGHGIGCFLNVHEGPQYISSNIIRHGPQIGNVLSNEPGCYIKDKFGIRIENLISVKPFVPMRKVFDWEFLQFETISLIPMHQNLIDCQLLTEDEIKWLNDYHSRCVVELTPELEKYNFVDGLRYLNENTTQL